MTTITTLPATRIPAGTWVVDPSHSRVGFAVKMLGLTTVRGEFREFEGTIEIAEDLADSRAGGVVKTASVDTGNERRDEHLRSADFLDAGHHPELRFESTRIEAIDDDTLRIAGRLELHGTNREIELSARVRRVDERVVLDVTGSLARSDFGMRRFKALVGDAVELELAIAA